MPNQPLDFRSDTVTRPTPAMRAAMAEAEVGDDVLSDDPTVRRLEETLAQMLGKETAVFVPSGTMSNQLGVRVHCGPGDEFICDVGCHIYNYEQGGYAQLSAVAVRTVAGDGGVIQLDQLVDLIRPEDDHLVRTKMIALENTHNRGSGKILPYDGVVEICRWAHENGLATHLDGARLMNAVVASGISAQRWTEPFDTVSVCFSKGLGAPVGSALAGPRDKIKLARRYRKLLGGGMRQAGIIAAGALYALEHHVDRLAEDHANAQQLAAGIRAIDGLELRPPQVDTNIVIFHVDPRLGTAAEFSARLHARGLLMLAVSKSTLRAVTHLDVSSTDVERALGLIGQAIEDAKRGIPVERRHSAYA
jgi:threonine aldolase